MAELQPADPFDARLATLVRAYGDAAVRPFDPLDVTRTARVRPVSSPLSPARWRPALITPRLVLLVVVAVALITLIAVFGMASRRHVFTGPADQLLFIRPDSSLVTADPDGSNQRVIATFPVNPRLGVREVRWSSSHRYLAVTDLMQVTPTIDRSSLVLLTAAGTEVGRAGPASEGWAWSPVDDVIAYGRGYDTYDPAPGVDGCRSLIGGGSCTGAIVIAGPDGVPRQTIGHNLGHAFLSGWSPDGRRLAVTGCPDGPGCSTDSASEIWIVEADGSGITPLTVSPTAMEGGATWSPDGATLAYAESACDTCPVSLWIANGDGSNPRLIAEGDQATGPSGEMSNAGGPLWAPTSDSLAYEVVHRVRNGNVESTARTDLYVWRDGRSQLLLSPEAAHLLGWSRDGSQILYSASASSGIGASLWVVNVDGSDPHPIVEQVDPFADW